MTSTPPFIVSRYEQSPWPQRQVPNAAAPSVSLELVDPDSGFLPNRLTTVQRNAIKNPPTGLTIYNTDTSQLESYNGSTWEPSISDATTAPVGTNTTQIATTAFVQANQLGINVMASGATGNGSTDDAPAINEAISSLGGAGGIVYFPPGVYIVGMTITLPSNVTLRGSGRGTTIIRAKPDTAVTPIQTTNFGSLTGTNSVFGVYKFGLGNLSVDGNKANGATGNGINIYGIDFNIEDVEINNCSGVGFHSEWSTNNTVPTALSGDSMEAHIIDLKVGNCGGDGIDFYGPHDSHVSRIFTWGHGGIGLNISASGGGQFNTIHSYGNTGDGLTIAAGCNCVLNDIESETNGGNGITNNGSVNGSTFFLYSNTGSGLVANGITTIAVVETNSNGAHGILLAASSTVSNITARTNGTDGITITASDVAVCGLVSDSNTGNGVTLSGSLDNVTVVGGECVGNTGDQINFGSAAQINVQLVTYNGAGQTSYAGTYQSGSFVYVATGGSGALANLFAHP
jgi:hypothetical protein